MIKPDSDRKQRPTPPKLRCCDDPLCDSGLRNQYFKGKPLSPDSFRVEQRYMIERRHLLNRAIHGWGVVFGYPVKAEDPRECRERGPALTVGAGLALDECGRELFQTHEVTLQLTDLILLEKRAASKREPRAEEDCEKVDDDRDPPECWLLCVHYAERDMEPVDVHDPCSCERREWDRTCESVRYSLRPIDCRDCCEDFDCELHCECATGPCCGHVAEERSVGRDIERRRALLEGHSRGGCRCLCEHLTRLDLSETCGALCETHDDCESARVDIHHGVPLACVALRRDGRGVISELLVEDCGPRRLVKRNDLLFDLIRGCDLTRLEIGWQQWHRREDPIPFPDFSAELGPEGTNEAEYVTTAFWVTFSRPVRADSVRPDSFILRAITPEGEGGWWVVARAPIVRIEKRADGNDPPGHIRAAGLVLDGAWLEDAVRGRKTVFHTSVTRIEVEIRGDFIVDCNGQKVDANANGTPGGTFVSTFCVAKRDESPERQTYARVYRDQGASS